MSQPTSPLTGAVAPPAGGTKATSLTSSTTVVPHSAMDAPPAPPCDTNLLASSGAPEEPSSSPPPPNAEAPEGPPPTLVPVSSAFKKDNDGGEKTSIGEVPQDEGSCSEDAQASSSEQLQPENCEENNACAEARETTVTNSASTEKNATARTKHPEIRSPSSADDAAELLSTSRDDKPSSEFCAHTAVVVDRSIVSARSSPASSDASQTDQQSVSQDSPLTPPSSASVASVNALERQPVGDGAAATQGVPSLEIHAASLGGNDLLEDTANGDIDRLVDVQALAPFEANASGATDSTDIIPNTETQLLSTELPDECCEASSFLASKLHIDSTEQLRLTSSANTPILLSVSDSMTTHPPVETADVTAPSASSATTDGGKNTYTSAVDADAPSVEAPSVPPALPSTSPPLANASLEEGMVISEKETCSGQPSSAAAIETTPLPALVKASTGTRKRRRAPLAGPARSQKPTAATGEDHRAGYVVETVESILPSGSEVPVQQASRIEEERRSTVETTTAPDPSLLVQDEEKAAVNHLFAKNAGSAVDDEEALVTAPAASDLQHTTILELGNNNDLLSVPKRLRTENGESNHQSAESKTAEIAGTPADGLPLLPSSDTLGIAEVTATVPVAASGKDSARPLPKTSARKRATASMTPNEPPAKARHSEGDMAAKPNLVPPPASSSSPAPPLASATTQTPSPTASAPSSSSTKPVLNIAGVNVQGLLAESSDPPPVYLRRQRRTRRKPLLAEDHPIFAEHRDLWQHDQTRRIIARAPCASDADVLNSLVEWRDSPSLVYARLLWRYAPKPFLHVAMHGVDATVIFKPEPKAPEADGVVVKKEDEEN